MTLYLRPGDIVTAPVPIIVEGHNADAVIGGTERRECQVLRRVRFHGYYWLRVVDTACSRETQRCVFARACELELLR